MKLFVIIGWDHEDTEVFFVRHDSADDIRNLLGIDHWPEIADGGLHSTNFELMGYCDADTWVFGPADEYSDLKITEYKDLLRYAHENEIAL